MSLRDTRAANELPDGESVAGLAAGRAVLQARRAANNVMRFPDHTSYLRYQAARAQIQLRQQFRAARAAAAGPEPTIPDAPTDLSVLPGNKQITINFSAPASDGGASITNYEFSMDGITWTAFTPAITSSPVTITSLTNGVIYTIYLRARNTKGTSATSLPVSATPLSALFNPRSISDSQIWLDGICSETVILTSNKVSAWSDKSAAITPNDFTVAVVGQNITYALSSGINSRPAVYFTAPDLSLERTANISASNNLTVFIVVQQTNSPSGRNSELFFSAKDPNNLSDTTTYKYFDLFSETGTNGTGTLTLNLGGIENDSAIDIITTPPTSTVISAVISSSGNVYVDGSGTSVSGAIRGSAPPYNTLNKALTWALSRAGFAGYMGEVVAYNKALTTAERQHMEGYLTWKWGLQARLPNTHPFFSRPPGISYDSLSAAGTANSYVKFANDSNLAIGTRNFTIEWFQYWETGVGNFPRVFSIGSFDEVGATELFTPADIAVSYEGSNFYFWKNGTSFRVGTPPPKNEWVHIAIVGDGGATSGGTIKVYQNGTLKGTVSGAYNFANTTYALTIGNETDNAANSAFKGKLTNFRWVVGSGGAIYTEAFTPPPTPLASVTGTELLLLTASSGANLTDSSSRGRTATAGFDIGFSPA
jgi:hypothetical protein